CYSNLVILEMKLNSISVPNEVSNGQNGGELNNLEAQPATETGAGVLHTGGVSTSTPVNLPITHNDGEDAREADAVDNGNSLNEEVEEDKLNGENVEVEEDLSEELEKY